MSELKLGLGQSNRNRFARRILMAGFFSILLSGCEERSSGFETELVYVVQREKRSDVERLNRQGEHSVLASLANEGDVYPVKALPNREVMMIEVTGVEDQGSHTERLVVISLDTGSREYVGPPNHWLRNPDSAQDASWFVFESDAESFRDIYRVDRRTGDVERLTDNQEGNFEPAVSPRDGTIMFVSSRSGDSEIYSMNPDGSDQTRLTAFHKEDWNPSWSPDGRQVAFLSSRAGRDEIFLMDPNGANQRKLNAERISDHSSTAEAQIAWAPGSDRIAHVTSIEGRSRVCVTDVSTGERSCVTPEGVSDTFPAWSLNGELIAVSREVEGRSEIAIMNPDGSNPSPVSMDGQTAWLPVFVN